MLYHSLEHWRGFAALWVMLFHAIGTQDKQLHPLVEALKVPARPGWLGVHLFFVISGYCIAANVHSLRARHVGAINFLRDRLWRILPTYWAAFGVTLLLAIVAAQFNHTTAAENYPATTGAWLGDLLLIQPYLGTQCYVVVYWTLVIELGFYFTIAVLFVAAGVSEHLAVWLAAALALGGIAVPPWRACLVLACWPEFACGMLVFYAVVAANARQLRRKNVCLGGILLLGAAGWIATRYQAAVSHSPKQLAFSAAFALLLYLLYPLDAKINGTRALRWLSFCGLFSFSLYLIHAPFGVRVYGLASRFFPERSPGYALLVLAFCVVSVVASYVFYRIFEMRFEIWRRRCKARPFTATS